MRTVLRPPETGSNEGSGHPPSRCGTHTQLVGCPSVAKLDQSYLELSLELSGDSMWSQHSLGAGS